MQRLLAMLLVLLLAFTVACGDDDDGDDDDATDVPTPTLTTGTGGATTATTSASSGTTATTGGGGGEGDAANGQQLAASNGCTGCHSIDGSTLVGPTWQGLYGREVELEGGDTVTADDAYITESIKDPGAKIVAGFTNIMPVIPLDDAQINDIIAYIKTLE